jgi:hypothetical protein
MAPLGDCFVLLLQTGSPAEKFGEEAKTYANNPTAFHLRAMNMLYEGVEERKRNDRHRVQHRRRNDGALSRCI